MILTKTQVSVIVEIQKVLPIDGFPVLFVSHLTA